MCDRRTDMYHFLYVYLQSLGGQKTNVYFKTSFNDNIKHTHHLFIVNNLIFIDKIIFSR